MARVWLSRWADSTVDIIAVDLVRSGWLLSGCARHGSKEGVTVFYEASVHETSMTEAARANGLINGSSADGRSSHHAAACGREPGGC